MENAESDHWTERHCQARGQAEIAHSFPELADGNDIGHDGWKRRAAHAEADPDENAQQQKQGDVPSPEVSRTEDADSAQGHNGNHFAVFRAERFACEHARDDGGQRKQADDETDDKIVCLIRLFDVRRERRRLHLDRKK